MSSLPGSLPLSRVVEPLHGWKQPDAEILPLPAPLGLIKNHLGNKGNQATLCSGLQRALPNPGQGGLGGPSQMLAARDRVHLRLNPGLEHWDLTEASFWLFFFKTQRGTHQECDRQIAPPITSKYNGIEQLGRSWLSVSAGSFTGGHNKGYGCELNWWGFWCPTLPPNHCITYSGLQKGPKNKDCTIFQHWLFLQIPLSSFHFRVNQFSWEPTMHKVARFHSLTH